MSSTSMDQDSMGGGMGRPPDMTGPAARAKAEQIQCEKVQGGQVSENREPVQTSSNAKSWSPHPKVAMSGVGASLATVLVWGAAQMGLALPVEVAVAAAGLIIFVLGYLTPGK